MISVGSVKLLRYKIKAHKCMHIVHYFTRNSITSYQKMKADRCVLITIWHVIPSRQCTLHTRPQVHRQQEFSSRMCWLYEMLNRILPPWMVKCHSSLFFSFSLSFFFPFSFPLHFFPSFYVPHLLFSINFLFPSLHFRIFYAFPSLVIHFVFITSLSSHPFYYCLLLFLAS